MDLPNFDWFPLLLLLLTLCLILFLSIENKRQAKVVVRFIADFIMATGFYSIFQHWFALPVGYYLVMVAMVVGQLANNIGE